MGIVIARGELRQLFFHLLEVLHLYVLSLDYLGDPLSLFEAVLNIVLRLKFERFDFVGVVFIRLEDTLF